LSFALIKRWSTLALPAVLLVASFAALPRVQALPQAQRELAFYLPYLVLFGGIALSLAFNRGRVFLSLLVLSLFYLLTRSFLQQRTADYLPHTLHLCLSLVIPINLALFCFMRERGVFTNSGRLRLGFLATQALVVFWLVHFRQDFAALCEIMGRPIFGSAFLERLALPQAGLLLFLLAGVLISVRVFKRRFPIDIALMGTLAALGISLSRIGEPFVPVLFVTAAALLLTIGVLQDSYKMAFFDDLTGLPSRRALNEQVMGLGRHYVVAMLDVDHFKRFNDSYGHDVGDQVLKMVGVKMAAVRGGGKPFRYGGEEFTVIFPGKNLKEATPHLEEVRQAIGSYRLWIRGADRPKEPEKGKAKRSVTRSGGKEVSVTISIGVAAANDQTRSPSEVIKAADQALYRAKERGRNQLAS
jgi:GGDEF domain-containing protein